MYQSIASDVVSVKTEVSGLLVDLYNAYNSGEIPVPVPEHVARILDFKDQLEGWFDELSSTFNDIDAVINGNNCQRFTVLADRADDIAGLIPSF